MFSANSSQVSADQVYVEDVFSTWLYTGNGSTQTITNGIDLAGKGGMVWLKPRDATGSNLLRDTARGGSKLIITNTTGAEQTTDAFPDGNGLQFNSNGFSLGPGGSQNSGSGFTYASWTFRKAPKFFDVVTYTGDGNGSGQTISHALGAVPGCIIIKPTSTTGDWIVTSRKGASSYSYGLKLNATNAETGGWTGPSSTTTFNTFIGNTSNETNTNGVQYVAYLFAHDTTSDGIIQCGSFTTPSSSGSVTLGWEPQWILVKKTNAADDWMLYDTMRGWGQLTDRALQPNTSVAEFENGGAGYTFTPNATGFNHASYFPTGNTYIYIAIRRGPMRTPTSGTSVFAPVAISGDNTNSRVITTTIRPDAIFYGFRNQTGRFVFDRLRGNVVSNLGNTNAEFNSASLGYTTLGNTSYIQASSGGGSMNVSGWTYINWAMTRAPGFFDEVCYTGNDVAGRTINHNLGVVPEMIIVKGRIDGSWWVQNSSLGPTKYLVLNTSDASGTASSLWNNTAPTSSVFTIGNLSTINFSGYTYVAYLFASCPGVSKVGSYTGNGSSQTINCGFAAGARFVMIKRTDAAGEWYIWDTARGINPAGTNDPYLTLNATQTEVTSNDSLSAQSSGFGVIQNSTTNINVSSATYIYLAVA